MPSTRFNFVSEFGDGMGFAKLIKEEGNDVRIWVRSSDAAEVGDGIVTKVGALEDLVTDASKDNDVFVFDGSANGLVADWLREKGYAVMGGSLLADRLERDRQFGTDAMVECGIDVPETKTFFSFEEGIKYAKRHNKRMVYKPSKMLGEQSCSKVCYDAEDVVTLLQNTRDEASLENPEFELQDFVEGGTCISTEAWFDGQTFLPLFNHTFERKELLDGNIGPSGGCTGNVVWGCGDCPVCQKMRQMEPWLRKHGYKGMLDLNAIISEKGFFGLEWTPRFGYDASPTMFYELVDGECGRLFADVARGQYKPGESPSLHDGIAGGIRITIPPWPTEKYHADGNVPIRGLTPEMEKHSYFYNVKTDEHKDGEYASAGAWGILLLLTGYGDSVKRSLAKPMNWAKELRIPDKQYRLDLVDQFLEDFDNIESLIGEELR